MQTVKIKYLGYLVRRSRDWRQGPRDMRAGPLGGPPGGRTCGPNRARAPCRGRHFISLPFHLESIPLHPFRSQASSGPAPAAIASSPASLARGHRRTGQGGSGLPEGQQTGRRGATVAPHARVGARATAPWAAGGGGGGWQRRAGGVEWEQPALLRSGSSSADNVSINCSVFRYSRSSCKVPRTSAGGCRSETFAASAVMLFVLAGLAGLPLFCCLSSTVRQRRSQ